MLLLTIKESTLKHLKYFFSDQVGRQSTTYLHDSEKQKKAHNFTNCSTIDQEDKENLFSRGLF